SAWNIDGFEVTSKAAKERAMPSTSSVWPVTNSRSTPADIFAYWPRIMFMPVTQYRSSLLTWTRRTYVATPRNSATDITITATSENASPKAIAGPARASATVDADSTDRNIEVRANASFQLIDRVASRLQCSVVRNCARRPIGSGSAGRVGVGASAAPPGVGLSIIGPPPFD